LDAGKLYRQNEGGPAKYIKTDWIPIDAWRSNRGVLRLVHSKEIDWPIGFVEYETHRKAEWREYTRSIRGDGTVISNDKRLVLSCRRCKVDFLGITYDCKQ